MFIISLVEDYTVLYTEDQCRQVHESRCSGEIARDEQITQDNIDEFWNPGLWGWYRLQVKRVVKSSLSEDDIQILWLLSCSWTITLSLFKDRESWTGLRLLLKFWASLGLCRVHPHLFSLSLPSATQNHYVPRAHTVHLTLHNLSYK